MHKLLKKGALLLCAGMALLGTGVLSASAEVLEEDVTLGGDWLIYYRLCHTDGWYYNENEDRDNSSKRDGIQIFGYDGPDEDLVIPETLDGFEVVAVSDKDPEISSQAEISRKVKSIKISKSIKAFNPVVSEGWEGDDDPCYYYGRPILQLSNLERYEVSPDNSVYKSVDGVLFSKNGKHLVNYPPSKKGTRYEIPDGVEYICMDAFWDNQYLKTVVVPDSVKMIGSSAFEYAKSLTKVFIPASVRYMNTYFRDATVYCQKGSYAEKELKNHKEVYKYKSYAKPSKPGTVTVKTSKGGKASLSWKSVSGASGYEVYKSESKDDGWEKVKASVKGKRGKQTCNVSLKGEIAAWYRIRAYKKAGPGTIYGSYSKPVRVLAQPEAVKEVRAFRESSRKANIVWKSLAGYAEGCSGYQIYRSDSSSKKYRKVATIKKGYEDFYIDNGLEPGKTYYYKVRAYNSQDGKTTYGSFSKRVKAITIK